MRINTSRVKSLLKYYIMCKYKYILYMYVYVCVCIIIFIGRGQICEEGMFLL